MFENRPRLPTGRGGLFICSKLGENLSAMEVRKFVRKQRVIWDHLLVLRLKLSRSKLYFSFRAEQLAKNKFEQGRSQKKLMTEAMSMEDLWLRQSVHGWVLFLGIKSVCSDKSERKYRGKCLGWPVTSYGGDELELIMQSSLFFLSFSFLARRGHFFV